MIMLSLTRVLGSKQYIKDLEKVCGNKPVPDCAKWTYKEKSVTAHKVFPSIK